MHSEIKRKSSRRPPFMQAAEQRGQGSRSRPGGSPGDPSAGAALAPAMSGRGRGEEATEAEGEGNGKSGKKGKGARKPKVSAHLANNGC